MGGSSSRAHSAAERRQERPWSSRHRYCWDFWDEESNKELRVGEDGGTPAKDDKKFLRLSICILL